MIENGCGQREGERVGPAAWSPAEPEQAGDYKGREKARLADKKEGREGKTGKGADRLRHDIGGQHESAHKDKTGDHDRKGPGPDPAIGR